MRYFKLLMLEAVERSVDFLNCFKKDYFSDSKCFVIRQSIFKYEASHMLATIDDNFQLF